MLTEAPLVPDQTVGSERARASAIQVWLPIAGVIGLLIGATRSAARPLDDPDTWWHLRLGAEFWGPWSLGQPGQLSPFATRPWFATQWLPELVASKFEEFFGLPGVAWIFGAVLLAFVAGAYAVCRREADGLAASVATVLCFIGASGSLTARPQLVTFLLLLITTSAWIRTCRDLKARWWLVPLTWLWACSHGMWFSGVVVGVAVIVGLVLDRRLDRQTAARLGAVPLFSLLAAALTPVGPKLLLAPFATSGMAPFVTEWAPPSFRAPAPAITMLAICIVVFAWARRGRVPWAHIGVLFVATGWTLLSARTVALGAVMVTPLVAAAVQTWLPQRGALGITRPERRVIAVTSLACLAALALVVPSSAASPAEVPNELNTDLTALEPGTVLLNDYALGGWLTWRHPDLAPVIDGMTDAYTIEHVADYGTASRVEAGWRDFVTRTKPSYALLEQGSPLATALVERLRWKRIGTDEGFVFMSAPPS